ncbi:lysozyme inhibitor LprI family protein [Sphingomonas sp.]|uniref:lysozyme inhibitor LprI family protein n=1 Tax=Sphingomonas sp. TaxID=28214 RepID=UPI003B3BD31D
MPVPLISLLLALASATPEGSKAAGSFDRCLKQASSMLEDAACYSTEQERLEKEQQLLLQGLAARLRRPGLAVTDYPPAIKLLARAQAAWTDYRDADCEVMDHVFGAGNAAGLAGATCVIDHDTNRNAELRALLQKDHGEGCPRNPHASHPETVDCFQQERERLEVEQGILLERVTSRLKQPGPPSTDYAAAAAAMARAQVAWTTYFAAECAIDDHLQVRVGSPASSFARCVVDRYRTRNAVLRAWLEDYISGA